LVSWCPWWLNFFLPHPRRRQKTETPKISSNFINDVIRPRWRLFRRGSGKGTLDCNLCGWHGGFLERGATPVERHCPRCKSANRHRAIAWYLGQSGLLKRGSAFLHAAPEPPLRRLISETIGSGYETCDLNRTDVDHRIDLQTQIVAAQKFDVIMINHVLEHVPDDRAVLANLRRMCKPGGICIITVPMRPNGLPTDEDPTVTDPAERRRRFNQNDHLRLYGPDLRERIQEAGFTAKTITSDEMPAAMVSRHSLQGEMLFLAIAPG
jgi:SAM-dependent methyltransferase